MEEKYYSRGGVNLFYVKEGEGRPIILLHGNNESHELFLELIGLLAKDGFSVFAPDTRGHGKSDKVEKLHYADMAEDLAALIKEENLVKPVVYGFSDGGISALIFAAAYPSVLGRLIVSGVNLNPKALKKSFRLAVKVANFFANSDMLRLMLKEPDIQENDLKKIDVPTLVTHAEKEIIKRSHSERIASLIPQGEFLYLPGEQHHTYVADNKKLFRIIADWVGFQNS